MISAYLDEMWVHFLESHFLKCNGNIAFLYKNIDNIENGPFCLQSGTFCYVWWLSFFSKQGPR